MSNIQNVRLVSPVNGCSRVTFLAENLTTGIASIFSIKMSMPDQGLSYSTDYLKGRVPETQYNTDCNGVGIGLTSGNTTYAEGEISLTFGDDYNLLQSIDPSVSRSIVEAVFKGGSFKIGSDTYSIIGTNGVRNIGSYSNDQDFKYVFLKDGEVIVPDYKNADGTMGTEANNFVTAYKKNNCVAMEFLYAFDDNNKKGDRTSYLLGKTYNFNEGSSADYNRYEISAARYSDWKAIQNYMIDGLTNTQETVTVLTGTVATNGDTSLEGTTTAFTTQLTVGDYVLVEGETADRVVDTITDLDSVVVESAFTTTASGLDAVAVNCPSTIYRLSVDGIFQTAAVGKPTVAGALGDIIASVDSGTGAVEIWINTDASTGWTELATPTFGQGCLIYSTKTSVDLSIAPATTAATYVAIKTAGTSGNAIATSAKTGTGTGLATKLFTCYDWVYSSQLFSLYNGTEV